MGRVQITLQLVTMYMYRICLLGMGAECRCSQSLSLDGVVGSVDVAPFDVQVSSYGSEVGPSDLELQHSLGSLAIGQTSVQEASGG